MGRGGRVGGGRVWWRSRGWLGRGWWGQGDGRVGVMGSRRWYGGVKG